MEPREDPDLVAIELSVSAPPPEVERTIAPWLWSWIWPWAWGDHWREAPSIAQGLARQDASVCDWAFALPPVAARGTLSWEQEPVSLYHEGGEHSLLAFWLVSRSGRAPAQVEVSVTAQGARLRLLFHSSLMGDAAFRGNVASKLRLLLEGCSHPVELNAPEELSFDRAAVDPQGALARIDTLASFMPELEQVTAGALVAPRLRAYALWLAAAARRSSPAPGQAPVSGTLRKLLSAAQDDGQVAPRALDRMRSSLRAEPSRGSERPERVVGGMAATAWLLDDRGERHERQGELRELVRWARHESFRNIYRQGCVKVGPSGATSETVTDALATVADRCALILLGTSGPAQAVVSDRLLRHGPWRVEAALGDARLVQVHRVEAPEADAAQQRHSALADLSGLLVPSQPQLPSDLAEYDPDTRSVLVRPRHVPDLFRKLAHIISWSRAYADDPRQPVERVLAPIPDPTLARLWLPVLWLREIAVWTILDGQWTRIDQGYQPSWGSPGWCAWDREG